MTLVTLFHSCPGDGYEAIVSKEAAALIWSLLTKHVASLSQINFPNSSHSIRRNPRVFSALQIKHVHAQVCINVTQEISQAKKNCNVCNTFLAVYRIYNRAATCLHK